ncbi:hypothetical protein Tco_1212795 [Tanacetum coccineum]
MPPRMRTRSAGRPAAESLGGGTGERVSRGGRGRRPREGNDERVDELNGQGNGLGMGANGGVEGANGNVGGANGGAPDFPTIIAQQLRNLLPAMLAQVSNQGNVGNQNGNVVNENVQGNVGNVIVNGNRVGCSYKEFLACNPKEYDGKGGVVALTRWIEKMEFVHDMSGCSIDQKAVKNETIKKVKKRGNVGEPSKDRNGRDDNKRTRTFCFHCLHTSVRLRAQRKEILLKMNLSDHRIKLWLKWRYLVPVESIYSPMLTLNVFNQRQHDNLKTDNTTFATLISNVMIKKSVSMLVRRSQHYMKEMLLNKDD